jgi:hypothetical protein
VGEGGLVWQVFQKVQLALKKLEQELEFHLVKLLDRTVKPVLGTCVSLIALTAYR